jgi:two-component system alkaline phosphatase synthesis response regulator PhoP
MHEKKVLVVDDEPNIVKMLEARLSASGYAVITASNGLEALNKARSEKPDLIILDVMLPEMDGFKVCAMLKYDLNHARIPIIMLTARAHESDKQMGDSLGIHAYIVKPFDGKQLMEIVNGALCHGSCR